MNSYYILIKTYAVFVKEADFFKEQGGLKDEWGAGWKLVSAKSIEHARAIGEVIRLGGNSPDAENCFHGHDNLNCTRCNGNEKSSLSFQELRFANVNRLPLFKNKHGELAHSSPDGSDWSPSQWLQAVLGELGEYANLRKKYERGDIPFKEFQKLAGGELADTQVYLDILAFQLGLNLGDETAKKFNVVSDRIGVDVFLPIKPSIGLNVE